MKDASVYCIVVTFNGLKWIDRCLGSLKNSSVHVNAVVIDNCSTDGTVEYIMEYYPETHLIKNAVNFGFGQANNQGITFAFKNGATHFFLLNQDAWINEHTLERLIQTQERHDLTIVSPIHLNGAGDVIDYNYFISTVVLEKNIDFVSDLLLNSLRPFYAVYRINAAAWLLSRRTVSRIGGFDPVFFHYGEDGNYCQRVRFHGGQVVFVPNAFIYHDRVRHGNVAVYKRGATLMKLFYEYCDINKSFWNIDKTRIFLHATQIKLGFKLLVKGKIFDFINLLKGYLIFFAQLPRVFLSRKNNQVQNSNWLHLD